jgi:hypothetical protein
VLFDAPLRLNQAAKPCAIYSARYKDHVGTWVADIQRGVLTFVVDNTAHVYWHLWSAYDACIGDLHRSFGECIGTCADHPADVLRPWSQHSAGVI